MSEIVSFGEWVQKRRNQLRYSRRQFAEIVGCAPVTIKKIERDERRPSEEMAELFAQHLQIPQSEKDDFIQRGRGTFIPQFAHPKELAFTEAQAVQIEDEPAKSNLPSQSTTFVGRDAELVELNHKLSDPSCRLVTILGPGGMGKTRLAIEAGLQRTTLYTDGVAYVELAAIQLAKEASTINPLAGALAEALNISFQGSQSPEQQLFNYLRRQEKLIIFDNIEHLVSSATFITNLLAQAPDISILTTSRERLKLKEEWLLVLGGLAYPSEPPPNVNDDLALSAVGLFADRALQARSSFDLDQEYSAVLQICRLVEGMPLGLELAAAWVMQLSCQEIAEEIETEIDFLSSEMRNFPERQKSMRAIFRYSWEKLTEKEQDVLQKLSIFRGGFERSGAKSVAGATLMLLGDLVSKSLLSIEDNGEDGPLRYHFHELMRQFAAEKLERRAEIADEINRLHSSYFLTLVGDQASKLFAPDEWLSILKIRQEIDNIRAAISWAINYQHDAFTVDVASTLIEFFESQGWHSEGESIFRSISEALRPNCVSNDVNQLLNVYGPCQQWAVYYGCLAWSLRRLDRWAEAKQVVQQALPYLSKIRDPQLREGRSISLIRITLLEPGLSSEADLVQILEAMQELSDLHAKADSTLGEMFFLLIKALFAPFAGDYEHAHELTIKVEQILTGLGSELTLNFVKEMQGRLARYRGDFAKAKRFNLFASNAYKKLGSLTRLAITLTDRGENARLQGNFQEAADYYQQAIIAAKESNVSMEAVLWGMGNLAVDTADFATAKLYFEESGLVGNLFLLGLQGVNGGLGWVSLGLDELQESKAQFQTHLQVLLKSGMKPLGLDALVGMAHIQARSGQINRALELLVLVQNHPASNYEIKQKANSLWGELTAEISPDLIEKAVAKGQELNLFETAEALLAEESKQ